MNSLSREVCKICYHANRVGFAVPNSVWEAVVPEGLRESAVCLNCFTYLGDKKGVYWDRDIEFFPVSLVCHEACQPERVQESIQAFREGRSNNVLELIDEIQSRVAEASRSAFGRLNENGPVGNRTRTQREYKALRTPVRP